MISNSSIRITWIKPEIEEEQWEFSRHPAKQEYYQRHAIDWPEIVSASNQGELIPYPRSGELGTIKVSLSYHNYEDYSRYLAKAKRGYRLSYAKMENDLQRNGELTLKAPIILALADDGLLFSGYRRLCLAWNYGMVPYIWLVTLNAADRRKTTAVNAECEKEIPWESSSM
ncbi:hypothetical protein OR1_02200 [Geobacter sp. OR-1]|uniref:hypothetical protein n=1 Tax=Geobacter sp. OR-1 TaxID=1266765 RepID=UPI000542D4C5|nr:hypothetical protein [Geobacter sp. OR-1]GAM09918.1 hypothetical protein OR1_02200 [Geobacter sp. OR-1]